MSLLDAYIEAFNAKCEHPDDWHEHVDPETMNFLSSRWFVQDRDTPAKIWSQAKANHPAVYRFLRVDPADKVAVYALDPFRVHADPETGKSRILAAYPCPRMIDDLDDHTGIEQVISWAPQQNAVEIFRDPHPQLFGAFTDADQGTLFADPVQFFRAWIEARAAWASEYLASAGQSWRIRPVERDPIPGCLAVGDVDRIPWAPHALPQSINCVGIDPKSLNRAILKAARLPFATSDNLSRKAA